MDSKYVLVDVFADQPFSGNQLAVFPDARGLSDGAMQALARELNLAETTFVLPARLDGALRRVRIFTPRSELPFAGHPTIGTAAVLAHLGILEWHGDSAKGTLEEGIGPVRVTVSRGVAPLFTELALEASVEIPAVRPDRGHVAAALSLDPTEILDCWFASVGLPFCFAHVGSRAAVDRARLERSAWRDFVASGWSPHLYFFAGDLGNDAQHATLHARMFAPALGIEEDPATGSAAAALAGSLAARTHGTDADVALDIAQGVSMGRPSRIHARATKRGGIVARVSVAGSSVIVGQGTMHVADER
ncbi:MAG TPA: PhzF family phenazine biosynthesis protein [Polyangiaceae bacterium]|jgi:trans-2,3-dihydro-3-hydroxyanthranilate isomerase